MRALVVLLLVVGCRRSDTANPSDDLPSLDIQAELEPLHVPMSGLENADYQHDLLETLYDARMLRATVASSKDRAELRAAKLESLRGYCNGTKEDVMLDEHDRPGFQQVGYTDDEIAGLTKTLVYDRSAAWIPKLETLFAGGDVVIAVGAGHLRGPKGVPALLTAAGYTVTRVMPPR